MKRSNGGDFQARQGDVLLLEGGWLEGTTQVETEEKIELAHGEATGHAHVIRSKNAALFETSDKHFFVVIRGGGASLQHDEHAPVEVGPGTYRVVRQREWQDEEIRNVED